MAMKMFCDKCQNEITNNVVSNRITFGNGRFRAECMITIDKTTNGGHMCLKCLQDIVRNGAVYQDGELLKEW